MNPSSIVATGQRAPSRFPLEHDNATSRLADASVISVPLIRRQGIDEGAGLSIAFALTGATGWTTLWLLSR